MIYIINDKFFFNVISAIGNANILNGHINFFEDGIQKNEEFNLNKIDSAHHFAAWLRFYCELISNDLFHSYYRLTKDKNIYNLSFDDVIKYIRLYHAKNNTFGSVSELDKIRRLLGLVLDLRHCFQHGGMPNYLRDLQTATKDNIDWFVAPSNYKKIKELFEKAYTFSDRLPKKPGGLNP
mgnify:CR=1 FL=1